MSPCPPCSERMYGDIFLEVLEIDLSNLLREMFKTRVLKTHTRDVRGGARVKIRRAGLGEKAR